MNAALPRTHRDARDTAWWLISVALHLLVLGAVVWFTPLREVVLPDAKKANRAVTVSKTQAERVMTAIERRESEAMRAQIEDMLRIRDELADLSARERASFDELRRELSSDAPRQASELVSETEAAMQTVIELQKKAVHAAAELANKRESAGTQDLAPQKLREIQNAIAAAQTEARRTQERAADRLGFAGEAYKQAVEAQQAAAEAQNAAAQAQKAAAERQNAVSAHERARKQSLDRAAAAERKRQSVAATEKQKSEKLRNAKNLLATWKERLEKAKPAGANTAKLENSVKAQRKQAAKAAAELEAATEARKKAEQAISKAAKTSTTPDPAATQREAAAMQKTAMDVQEKAAAAQLAATTALAKALTAAAAAPPASATESQPAAPAFDTPDLTGMDLAAMYGTATQVETQAAEAYKHLRAAQLAMLRQIPLEWALDSTQTVVPVRPDLAESLSKDAAKTQTIEQRKAAIEAAEHQTGSMVMLARNMLHVATGRGSSGEAGVPVSLLSQDYQHISQLASEDAGAQAKDLSAAMRAAGGNDTGEGTSLPSPDPDGAGRPPEIPRTVSAVPGRRIGTGGLPSGWMYVDSWYVIGPFPNPQRVNIDTKFPPDSVVDLDAAYEGAGGKIVRWQFQQATGPRIIPKDDAPYGIFYACTELWFDQPGDLWIAVGSDDNSRIWINDQPVWLSGYEHKVWRIDEGLRKVHFKQGRNRILYRIENGQHGTAFSLLIATNPDRNQ